jgi:hypothetical protein
MATQEANDPRKLDGINQKANPQMFHMGKQRLDAVKLNTNKIKEAHTWIEANMEKFVAALQTPYSEAWVDPSTVSVPVGGVAVAELPRIFSRSTTNADHFRVVGRGVHQSRKGRLIIWRQLSSAPPATAANIAKDHHHQQPCCGQTQDPLEGPLH